ncbi:MAG: hypothetical protein F7C07_08350 [Desulfurococcales archaeon]|nr:hypothetical protein [Desulfurococcales archaeon]
MMEARLLGLLKMIRDFQPITVRELEAIAWARGLDYGVEYTDWICGNNGCTSKRLRADVRSLAEQGLVRIEDRLKVSSRGLEVLALAIREGIK